MVSSFGPNQAFVQPRHKHEPLNFPFAAQPSPRKTTPAKTPSYTTSPSLTDITITDDETNTSSHDEFYLEKYSTNSTSSPYVRAGNGRGSSPKKRARPELNIVTHLPTRARDPDVTVEHVGAKRTASKVRPKSVVSSKAEHFDSSLMLERTRAFATIKNLAQARRDRKQARRADFERLADESTVANVHMSEPQKQESHESNESGSVVIGISIPKEQAAVHQLQGDVSAVTLDTPTPNTPAIVITPADADYPSDSKRLLAPEATARGIRPSSSVYSKYAFHKNRSGVNEVVPPVPVLPHIPKRAGRRESVSQHDAQQHSEQPARKIRQFSASTGDDVGRNEMDSSRHKSQGWWNLALSPMLSRAGTTKSQKHRELVDSPEVPPVPDAFKGRARSGTEGSQVSPETPRRLGLAGIRASVWSHWTTEHKGDRAVRASVNTTHPEHDDDDRDDDFSELDSQEPLPLELPFQDPMAQFQPRLVGGLADEYYHACAIEQLSGQQYFECENHSCAEQWPHFQSIFDHSGEKSENANQDQHPRSTQEDSGKPGVGTAAAAGTIVAVAGAALAAAAMHRRTTSGESEPAVVSPNVRQADTGSVVQARAVEHKTPPIGQESSQSSRSVEQAAPIAVTAPPEPTATAVPTHNAPEAVGSRSVTEFQQTARYPNIAAIVPPPATIPVSNMRIVSPGPVSPEMQQAMSSQGAVPMTAMKSIDQQTQAPQPIIHNYYGYAPAQEVKQPSVEAAPQANEPVVASQKAVEADMPKKPGMIQRIKAWATARKAANASQSIEKGKRKRNRCIAGLICIGLLLMIGGSIALALLLTRRGDQTPTSTQWLNLTGYPPMPTGISTIIRPDVVLQQSQFVQPATAWSCSLPPENQNEVAPNNPDQPNFRFEIRFRNGTVASNMTIPMGNKPLGKRASDPFTNALFDPSPSPPPRAEQLFLGNTTDNITAPFDGEDTPFYMSFVPAFPIDPSDVTFNSTSGLNETSRLRLEARQQPADDSLAELVPAPEIDGSGLAAAANLLPVSPFPTSQPIRLYNRGQPDEHFGFYMYYDRSIFLTTEVNTNTTSPNSTIVTPDGPNTSGGNSSDANGGSSRFDARSRCTFSQTRFLVQIWTNPAFDGSLTGPVPEVGSKEAGNSAINYTPPGSFPYPTTITLDRHGGNVNKKAAYCYGVDGQQKIVSDVKSFLLEFRGIGGSIVNPAPDLLLSPEDRNNDEFSQEAGGIDGGTGGCKCAWQNWS